MHVHVERLVESFIFFCSRIPCHEQIKNEFRLYNPHKCTDLCLYRDFSCSYFTFCLEKTCALSGSKSSVKFLVALRTLQQCLLKLLQVRNELNSFETKIGSNKKSYRSLKLFDMLTWPSDGGVFWNKHMPEYEFKQHSNN